MAVLRHSVAELWPARTRPPAGAAYLVEEGGAWAEKGWPEVTREVEELAAGFLSLGLEKGDRVALLGRTRVEWALCDWALISIGAIVVPIYPTSSAVECAYILGNCGSRVIVCEDREQADRIESARRELEALEQVILFEEIEHLCGRGRALLADDPDAVERRRRGVAEDDTLTIVYTSGTTGPPKGCALTQRNYRAMVEMVQEVEGLVRPGDRVLLHLPLAHTFARLVSFLGPATGVTIAFCPDVAAIPQALTAVRPTLFPTVPRLYEKLAATVRANVEEAGGAKGRLARWALATGARASEHRLAGRRLPPVLAVERALADRLVLAKVRGRLGGELRFCISGGAPLAAEVAEFFHALGIVILEGYGLTECTTAATFNRPGSYRFGTVGQALPGVEVRIASDGEVLIRGENVFQGYYRDEEATRSVLTPDGWLATGDIGELDPDGFLTITDRKKDLIVTAGGKNVSPQSIENALKGSRYVSEALVVGDRRPYLVALLAIDHDEVGKVARTEEDAHALIEHEVEKANADRGQVEQVRRFAILPRELSQEASELTPTLKVRRHVCQEHFREEIERLYARA
ncbi:MAG TPA: long-chain fatty acid--CoA ligase [Longimicrobiaceae bacterium]|nr:long-chain fatty acid--CoA ligase [Longimicrobiaceae bacterium]